MGRQSSEETIRKEGNTTPYYEYLCADHGQFEKFFPTFSEAKAHEDKTECPDCNGMSKRLMSVPLEAICYGEGFHKPAASGKGSYTTADPTKVEMQFKAERDDGRKLRKVYEDGVRRTLNNAKAVR